MTSAFPELVRDLDAFLALCTTLGLEREAAANRFTVYRARIQDVSREIERLRGGQPALPIYQKLDSDLSRHLVALAESVEIGQMMSFMRSCSGEILKPRLKILLSGPEMPSDEDQASNQARNIQFELWLAATLTRAGAPVILAEPDLQCTIADKTILIACKRLSSVHKLNKRVNEAVKQLRKALSSLPKDKHNVSGVIAISLTRALPINQRSETIKSRSEGLNLLESKIAGFVERRAKWRRTGEIQAIVFQIASTFTNLEVGRIEYGSQLTMYGDGPAAAALNDSLQPLASGRS